MALCAALAFAACNKPEEIKDNPEKKQDAVDFAIYVNGETKTVNNGTKTAWVAGDSISVFLAEADAAAYVAEGAFTIAEEDLADGKFVGKITESLTEGKSYDWYAVYPNDDAATSPASVAVTFGSSRQTLTAGSTAALAGELVPLAGKGAGIAAADDVAFKMHQLAAIIKVTVKNNNTKAYTLSNINIAAAEEIVGDFTADITNPSAAVCTAVDGKAAKAFDIVPAATTEIASGAAVSFYAVVKPFTASTLSISINGAEAANVPAKAFTAGSIKEITVDAPAVLDPYPQFDWTMLCNCDDLSAEGFTYTHATGASIVKEGQKEGAGYLSRTMSGDAEIFCIKTPQFKTNITDKKKGHFVFWFYCSDAAGFKAACDGGDIEISSGDANLAVKTLRWGTRKWLADVITEGWNLIDLPLAAAIEINDSEPFDLNTACWFRLYTGGQGVAAERTYGIDALAFYESDEDYVAKTVFHNCDTKDFFTNSAGAIVDTENAQEGTGCVKFELGAGAVELVAIQRGANIIDAGCTQQTGHLHFKLYISDKEAFATGDGQIELSHSNAADNQEISWSTAAMIAGCNVGWNDIDLKFSEASGWGTGNDYNPGGTNWFRIYFVSLNKAATVMIDDIYFYAE